MQKTLKVISSPLILSYEVFNERKKPYFGLKFKNLIYHSPIIVPWKNSGYC